MRSSCSKAHETHLHSKKTLDSTNWFRFSVSAFQPWICQRSWTLAEVWHMFRWKWWEFCTGRTHGCVHRFKKQKAESYCKQFCITGTSQRSWRWVIPTISRSLFWSSYACTKWRTVRFPWFPCIQSPIVFQKKSIMIFAKKMIDIIWHHKHIVNNSKND